MKSDWLLIKLTFYIPSFGRSTFYNIRKHDTHPHRGSIKILCLECFWDLCWGVVAALHGMLYTLRYNSMTRCHHCEGVKNPREKHSLLDVQLKYFLSKVSSTNTHTDIYRYLPHCPLLYPQLLPSSNPPLLIFIALLLSLLTVLWWWLLLLLLLWPTAFN